MIIEAGMDLAYKEAERRIAKAKSEGATELYLSWINLTELPESIQELTSLKMLDLRGNQISDYGLLSTLTDLKELDLRGNQITDYGFLSTLTSLKELDLRENEISDISFITTLTSLQTLDLSGNQINDISCISALSGLKELDLSGNQVSDISFLSALTGLQAINLSGNKISDINPLYYLIRKGLSVHFRYSNVGLMLADNPITIPPLFIVKKGREAIVNYFEQAEEQGVAPLYEAKLMILGQGGAGKTTFARLQVNPEYDLTTDNPESTLGIEVYEEVAFEHQGEACEGVNINTRLWDFGGQNIQKMLHQFFITEDCLYVLVHDKRKENTDFDYWFQIIDLLGPGSPVIVLENQKGALGNNEAFALNKYQGLFKDLDIDREEVNLGKTTEEHKRRWLKLNSLIEEKLSKLEIVNRKVPTRWSEVRKLLTQKMGAKYLRIDDFYTMCEAEPIMLPKDQARLCLLYLKALGDVVYFEDRELDTHIFLDHNWLTEGVYYILSDTDIEKAKGKFTRLQAYAKWESKGYSNEARAKLLGLMLKNQFDLCYEISRDTFITPLLLPVDRPKSAKPIEANLHFRFQYGFMPHGLFSRAIVRLHDRIDGEKRWKSGVLLLDKKSGTKAEVQQFNDPVGNQQVIDVKIKGTTSMSNQMLDFVLTNIEPLHKEFKNLKVMRKVGCNCFVCQERMKSGQTPSFYDYKELQARLQNLVYFVNCPNDNYKTVSIGRVLSEIITEDAGEKSIDSDLLYRLKEMGMGINHIKNEAKVDMAGARIGGDAKSKSSARSEAEAKASAKAKSEVHIQIQNLLGHTGMIKDRIARDLKTKGENPEEIEYALSDVDMAEEALAEIESAQAAGNEAEPKSKSKLGEFIDDLSDEESTIYKTLKKLRKGRDYGVKLAETYNKIAGNIGMPMVPPLALDIIKSI